MNVNRWKWIYRRLVDLRDLLNVAIAFARRRAFPPKAA